MRNILLGVLLLPALAFAQPVTVDKTLVCEKPEIIIEELVKKYSEEPIWVGDARDSKLVVLVNSKSSTWTVLQFNGRLACVLETGEGYQVRNEKSKSKSF